MDDGFFQGSIHSTHDLLIGMEIVAQYFFWQQEELGLTSCLYGFADDACVADEDDIDGWVLWFRAISFFRPLIGTELSQTKSLGVTRTGTLRPDQLRKIRRAEWEGDFPVSDASENLGIWIGFRDLVEKLAAKV